MQQLFKFDFKVMGCPCSLQLYAPHHSKAEEVKATLLKELVRLDHYYTNYSDHSFTAAINRSAGNKGGIEIDAETAGLLDYAQACYEQSDGLFDITAGNLRPLWDFSAPRPTIPTQDTLQNALQTIGWQRVSWKRPILHLPLRGMALDFGGVVKEYAADVGATLCRRQGIAHGVLELGGDIAIIGPHPDGKPWKIGITNPHGHHMPLATIDLDKGGLASSGDYERFMEIDGKRYCHILNPKTGWPVEGVRSVSVHASHCLVAGSAATISFLKGPKEGPKWLKALNVPHVFADAQGNVYQ